jgi:deoxyribodipyrimidine photo-lyase
MVCSLYAPPIARFTRAFDFRRHLQKVLPAHLEESPSADPLSHGDLPVPPLIAANITGRWPAASQALLEARVATLDAIPIDHLVKPAEMCGGHTAARSQMTEFLKNRFPAYCEEHNKPELRTSHLSPHLHFGHISAHEIFAAIVAVENWRPEKLALRSNGAREGWWNMSAPAENFLDQLIT